MTLVLRLHVRQVERLLVLLYTTQAVGRRTEVSARESAALIVVERRRHRHFLVGLEVVVAPSFRQRVPRVQLVARPAVGNLFVIPLKRVGDAVVVGTLDDDLVLRLGTLLRRRQIVAQPRIFQSPGFRIVGPHARRRFPVGIIVAVDDIFYLRHLREQVVDRRRRILQIHLHTDARQVGDVTHRRQLIADRRAVFQRDGHRVGLAVGRRSCGLHRLCAESECCCRHQHHEQGLEDHLEEEVVATRTSVNDIAFFSIAFIDHHITIIRYACRSRENLLWAGFQHFSYWTYVFLFHSLHSCLVNNDFLSVTNIDALLQLRHTSALQVVEGVTVGCRPLLSDADDTGDVGIVSHQAHLLASGHFEVGSHTCQTGIAGSRIVQIAVALQEEFRLVGSQFRG